MKLIDAEALFRNLNLSARDRYDAIVNELIMNAPTVDAVPVVRCIDCRWGRETCGNIECNDEYHSYDWFCPNGKRKEK